MPRSLLAGTGWASRRNFRSTDPIERLERRSLMAGYPIGSIPSSVLANGNAVSFNVLPPAGTSGTVSVALTSRGYGTPSVSTDGAGVKTYQYSMPVVGSTLSYTFAPATGLFSYVPDSDDQFNFTVEFAVPGTSGTGLPLTQQIIVDPRTISPDGDLVSSTTENYPNPESNDYIAVNVLPGPTQTFNYIDNAPTREVEITGKTIVLDPGVTGGLYQRFGYMAGTDSGKNVSKLTINAERVLIRGIVQFPSTNITINAQELAYDDSAGIAQLVTTPVGSFAAAPLLVAGRSGMDAGSVTLNINSMVAGGSQNIQRIVLNGGRGQEGGSGTSGIAGTIIPPDPVHRLVTGGSPSTSIRVDFELANRLVWTTRWRFFGNRWNIEHLIPAIEVIPVGPTGTWYPSDGGPATAGAISGNGGRGGLLSVPQALVAFVAPRIGNSGGQAGQRAAAQPGGEPGHPLETYYYDVGAGPTPGTLVYDFHEKKVTSWGSDAAAGPVGSNGTNGSIAASNVAATAWATPSVLRKMLDYVKDAYLVGNVDYVRDETVKLDTLISTAPPAPAGTPDPYETLRTENQILRNRAEAGLDYFGNPAGWTPMLSFVANLSAYQSEIDSSLRIKYLAGLMDRVASNNESAAATMQAMLAQLNGDITRARSELNAHQALLPRLGVKSTEIAAQISQFQFRLVQKEQELLAQANHNLKPSFWRRALGVLGSIAKIVPIGQPGLGLIGTGLTTIANLSTSPLEAIGQFRGAIDIFKDSSGVLKQARNDFTNLANTLKPPSSATAAELLTYKNNLAAEGKKWSGALKGVTASLAPYSAPKDKLEAELARLKASDPTFKALVDELTSLNLQKEAFATELANTTKLIGDSIDQITANQQTALNLANDLADTTGRLDRETVEAVDDMGRRADERLLRYQYYLAKAYEYETLKPYVGSFQLAALETKIANVLSGGSAATWLNDPDNFLALKVPFESSLHTISDAILTEKNTVANNRRSTATAFFQLTPAELAQLNSDPDGDGVGEVVLNLGERADFQSTREESRKIVQISAQNIVGSVVGGGVGGSAEIQLEFVHGGTSLVRTGGHTYQFHHYRGGTLDQLVNELPIPLGLTRKNIGLGTPETNDAPSAQQLALLSYLLPGVPANSEVLYAQPGFSGDVRIRRYVTPSSASISLQSAIFKVNYSYDTALTNKATLLVHEPAAGQMARIAITSSSGELSNRTDGDGEFQRTFNPGSPVTLAAEPVYGAMEFDKWVNDQGQTLGEDPVLTRTLTTAGLSVRPLYLPSLTATATGTGVGYNFNSGQSIGYRFLRTPTPASLQPGDLVVTNTTTGQVIDASRFTVVTTPGSDSAAWTYNIAGNGPLPDGNYTAVLKAGSVADASGLLLSEDAAVEFFVLAGDANHDRKVDFDDLVVLAQNYNLSGKTFSQGNFNYSPDGKVDFDDLVILAQKYNGAINAFAALTIPPAAPDRPTKPRRPGVGGAITI